MGWMIIIAIKPLYIQLTGAGFGLLLLGGILYSVGTIFYIWRKIPIIMRFGTALFSAAAPRCSSAFYSIV